MGSREKSVGCGEEGHYVALCQKASPRKCFFCGKIGRLSLHCRRDPMCFNSMSSNCTFDFHISNLYKRCSNLDGWILRTFTMGDPQVMLTLYKSLVMSRVDYASLLWSPYLLKHVYLNEKVQRAFTKHITGMHLSYSKHLEVLKLYSLQRRRERYSIIYVWKIVEGLVPSL